MFDSTRSRRFRCLIALVTLWVGLYTSADAQRPTATTDDRPKRVLALHIIRRDSPGFDDAFRSALREGLSGRLDYYSEYIDLNRLGEERYQSALRTYLRTRYAEDDIDLVIASGPSVVDFLNRDPALFEGVPLVFTTRAGLLGGPNSTGIVSTIDFASTLSAAFAAQPDTRQVFVISGIAAFDKLYLDLFRTQRAPFETQVTFYDLAGLTVPELRERVQHLPPNSIVFYLSVSNDGAGHTVMPLDALDPIAAAANAPIYSWHEDALGHGIVGGRLHSSVNDAKQTAQIALRVLNGEKPDAIPVVTADSYAFQFDWRQLQRWQISEARLPPGSLVQYRQPSFFEQYRSYVVGGGLVFSAQALLIAGLLLQRRRRRRAEDALRHSETRNSAILRAIPDLMFVLDRNGTYLDFHARDGKLLFAPPNRFIGKTVKDVMPPDVAETFMTAIEKTRTSDEPVVIDYDLPMGELRHYEARLVPADDGRVVSIVRDITESKRAGELNRALAGRIIVSQEEERQRIAREVHDDLSQKVALLNLEVDQLANEVAVHSHKAKLEQVSSQVGEIAGNLSDLSHQLHPSRLQTLGLSESIRLLCREISQQRQVKVEFHSGRLPHTVDQGVSLCLYRIAQEALHNIAKHSQAREASIHLTHEGNHLHLEIADSGVGFDPRATNGAGLGLISMRERVGVLNGQLVINSSPGQGTRIVVRVPLTPPGPRARSLLTSPSE